MRKEQSSIMEAFLSPLKESGEYEKIQAALLKGEGIVELSGCIDSQKLHMIYGLSGGFKRKIIVTFSELKAKELYEDYEIFDKQVLLYPAKDFIFFQADIQGNYLTEKRLSCIKSMLDWEEFTLITTIDAFMDSIVPKQRFIESSIVIQKGEEIDSTLLSSKLIHLGYEKNHQVEMTGQFAVRGGIIDIFPLTEEMPYRIELWGEEVESIRIFDVESQRSMDQLTKITIFPALEVLLSKEEIRKGIEKIEDEGEKIQESFRKEFKTEEAYRLKTLIKELEEDVLECHSYRNLAGFLPYFCENSVSLLDYFEKEDTVIFLDEPGRMMEKGSAVETEFRESMSHRLEKGYLLPKQVNVLRSCEQVMSVFSRYHGVTLSTMEVKQMVFRPAEKFQIMARSINSYNNSFESLVRDLKNYKKNGYQVLLFSPSRTRAKRLAEDLRDDGLNSFYTENLDSQVKQGEIMVSWGKILKGYEYPLVKFAVISESDIFGARKKKKKKKAYEGQKIQSFTELSVGDYVVHENHGLGIYKGIEKIEVDKVTKDYMKIEYRDGGNLYILATGLSVIQKYASKDAKKPRLNKLGSVEWTRTKARVRGAVEGIAKDLVELYAVRRDRNGFEFSKDTVWQKEFEEMFPYEETEDQLTAIESTKKDMESPAIMDRLICGDVGYGKTEIAIRAAFKAVQDGKQVAYLVPTTILAQQHYNTFVQRMKDYPIRIDMLCRFRTTAQQKTIIEELKKGVMDIVIGTHRVLSQDVGFKDLGLLIIDEEQRFGVSHKEKMKKLKESIDVLTLTATPIPRTLHMSLIGIRAMSVLEEPPMDRMPIQTFVMEYNEEMIREAVHRELARNGQVYYVYNRVHNIGDIAAFIQELVPEASVSFIHGQMKERELEKVMYHFIEGEIDVLVSTTIIETGLDISNVNTIIIHDSDNMGLSQLYQLRGRVGRANRTAYAFLMYKRDKMLKEIAEKRLQAIKEYTEFGSGFKIAMKDLEIRGAGNILGQKQHGHMEAVGYDLYCKMLDEAIKRQKGSQKEESFETSVEINVDAYIPDTYVKNEALKLDIYKRIAGIETEAEAEDISEELLDRFGPVPKSVTNLIDISRIRILAHKVYVTEVEGKKRFLKFSIFEKAKLNPEHMSRLLEQYGGKLTFKGSKKPYFIYEEGKNATKETMENFEAESLELIPKILQSMKILLVF